MASELVLISIGKYDVLQSNVTLASGRTLHEWSFVDSATTTGNRNAVDAQRARWKTVLDRLETLFGPYPGNSIGVVVDIVPSGINYALETQDRPFFPTSIGDEVFVHEVAHQWYGDAVSPRVWNDIWINEGMATWAPVWFDDPSSTEETFYGRWDDTPSSSSNWTVPPAGMTDPADLYGFQTYARSAQMWEALRLSIGNTAYFTFVGEWQERFGGGSNGRADFVGLAEEISGKDLDDFFRDWLLDPDKPAWPQRYDLSLRDAATSTPLGPGETVTYTLTARNRGLAPLSSSVAVVDLGDVLDDATLTGGSLPAGLTRDGDTLVWQIPSTARDGVRQVGFEVEVDGDASNADVVATATSRTLGGFCAPTASCRSVLRVPGQPVTGTPDPTLRGLARVGRPLTVRPGRWDGDHHVQWWRGTHPIRGATSTTYRPVAADRGRRLTARVTYGRSDHTSISKLVRSTVVRAGVMTRRPVPRITGRARVGSVLTALPGRHDAGAVVRYQWLADNHRVPGATRRTFRIPPRLRGDRIRVRTITSKRGYLTLTKTSRPTGEVR